MRRVGEGRGEGGKGLLEIPDRVSERSIYVWYDLGKWKLYINIHGLLFFFVGGVKIEFW